MDSENQTAQSKIEALLARYIGLNGESLGTTGLAKAVAQAMRAAGFTEPAAYLQHLETSQQALAALIETVVVPETSFFRHPESFAYLQRYISAASKAQPQRRWRLLSFPCSTGEEPYSMAITLLEAGLAAGSFQIDGVDISNKVLAKARQGCFERYSFRKTTTYTPERHMHQYFQMSEERYYLDPRVRSQVQFFQGNLADPLCLSGQPPYDIIFCRNLLIYLHRAARNRAVETLTRLLVPDGLLFVGYADTGPIDMRRFEPVAVSHTFAYRKLPTQPAPAPFVSNSVIPSYRSPQLAVKTSQKLFSQQRMRSVVASAQAKKGLKSVPQQNLSEIRALADSGQLSEALEKCDRYLQDCPTAAAAHLLLGEIYQAKDESDRAIRAFQKALYLNPDCAEALTHLVLLHERAKDQVAARRLRQRLETLTTRLNR